MLPKKENTAYVTVNKAEIVSKKYQRNILVFEIQALGTTVIYYSIKLFWWGHICMFRTSQLQPIKSKFSK